jgi:hypothetical protein
MELCRNRHPFGPTLALLFVLLAPACSDSGTGPDKALEPLVGAWEAETLIMTNQANPSISVDLIEQGATFTLSILSTGQYSASLSAFGGANTEAGEVSVSGNQITITPTNPPGPPQVSTWSFQGKSLVLDGESEFDFNQDGETEASFAHMVLDPFIL